MSTTIKGMRAAGWLASVLGWSIGGAAMGQMAPVPSAEALPSTGPSAAMMMSNPYTNPYLNPYLNPTAPQRPISARDTAMYLYMANQANGGIGTGRISQTRPGAAGGIGKGRVGQMRPGAAGGVAGSFAPAVAGQEMMNRPISSRNPRAAEMPDSASLPGSGAARFFNPYPNSANGAGRYYNRRNTYFNSNGR